MPLMTLAMLATPTTFTVHVVDTTPPTIDAHDDVTTEATMRPVLSSAILALLRRCSGWRRHVYLRSGFGLVLRPR